MLGLHDWVFFFRCIYPCAKNNMIPILPQVTLPLNSKAVLIKKIGSLHSPSLWRRGKLKKFPNGLSNISVSVVALWLHGQSTAAFGCPRAHQISHKQPCLVSITASNIPWCVLKPICLHSPWQGGVQLLSCALRNESELLEPHFHLQYNNFLHCREKLIE